MRSLGLMFAFSVLLAACEVGVEIETDLAIEDEQGATTSFLITAPAAAKQSEKIMIEWGQLTGATGYDMVVAKDKACEQRSINVLNLTTQSQEIEITTPGTFYICVFANLPDGTKVPASNSGVEIVVGKKNVTPVFSVADTKLTLSAVEIDDAEIKLTWNKVTDNIYGDDTVEYEVFYSTADNINNEANIGANATSLGKTTGTNAFTVSTLTIDKFYYFNVVATGKAGKKIVYTMREPFCGGLGTSVSPYQVCDVGALQFMTFSLGSEYLQTSAIDASDTVNWNAGSGFKPIGKQAAGDASFTGVYDGGSLAISDLVIYRPTVNSVGLFHRVTGTNGTHLKNITLKNIDVAGAVGTGSISFVIENTHVDNITISGGRVEGNGTGTSSRTGGLAGQYFMSNGIMKNVHVDIVVKSKGENTGGLVGLQSGSNSQIQDCSFKGAVYALTNVGGIVGASYSPIHRCHAQVNIYATWQVGGISGRTFYNGGSRGDVYDSYATGAIQSYRYGGGIMGYAGTSSTVARSYSRVVLHNTDTHAGGIVGYATHGTYTNVFALGRVRATAHAGAIMGRAQDADPTITNAYYLTHKGQASACVATQNGSTVTNCNAIAALSYFQDQTNAPMSAWSWGATDAWVMSESTQLPAIRLEDGNQAVSWSPHFVSGAKVGNADANAFSVSGYCSPSGSTISFSGTAGAPADVTCTGGAWSQSWDLSALSDGSYDLTASNGSSSKSLTVSKDTGCATDLNGGSSFHGGDGSSGNPYIVCTLTELQSVGSNLTSHFKLGDNIDASGTSGWNAGSGFDPIGDNTTAFSGSFDGQTFAIRTLTIARAAEDYVGLFGKVDAGTFQNVVLQNALIEGQNYVGGVAGSAATTSTTGLAVTGVISGNGQYVGGAVGTLSSSSSLTLASSKVRAIVTTDTTSENFMGGLIGRVQAASNTLTITGADVWAFVAGKGDSIGGIVGSTDGAGTYNISKSKADVLMYQEENRVGGLVGYVKSDATAANLSENYATGHISLRERYAGGLVGFNNASGFTLTDSYADVGLVGSYNSSHSDMGGLVGSTSGGSIATSYTKGVVVRSQYDGYRSPFVGVNNGSINRVFTVGRNVVLANTTTIGAIVAHNDAAGTIANAYYLKSAALKQCKGTDNGTTTCSAATDATDFQSASSTKLAGWNFETVWAIPATTGYPVLKWQQSN